LDKELTDYSDLPMWKDFIIKWNTACDTMGAKQCLWVLRIEMKYDGYLSDLDPSQFNNLMQRLRRRYEQLKEQGKLLKVI